MLTTTLGALLAFCAAAALLSITPGPDTALILRLSAAEGRRSTALPTAWPQARLSRYAAI